MKKILLLLPLLGCNDVMPTPILDVKYMDTVCLTEDIGGDWKFYSCSKDGTVKYHDVFRRSIEIEFTCWELERKTFSINYRGRAHIIGECNQ